ncbi:signal peptidase I [Enterococcus sp. LJL99]
MTQHKRKREHVQKSSVKQKKETTKRTKKGKKKKSKQKNNFFIQMKTAKGRKKIAKKVIATLKQKETLLLIALFFILLLFFINFGRDKVDGQSMAPTFETNDRIILAKHTEPSRYAIISFEATYEKDTSYVKRIIGLPGDRIGVNGTKLYLLPRENEKDNLADERSDGTISIDVSELVAKELSEYERIPENMYFVQGDNRLHSDDSRVFGLINKKQIEGVVVYRYYPFSRIGTVH